MPVDYHIHTDMCGHASGSMEEYVREAVKRGLREIGFSDHIPMYFLPPDQRDNTVAMDEKQLPVYVERVRELQSRFAPFPVKLGIEADYTPGMEKELSSLIKGYDFDYVLGSIHFLDGWGFDNPEYKAGYEKWDILELYRSYFTCLTKAASSGLFDIISHPDLIKKFGYKPEGDIISLYEEAVGAIADSGACVEINTAGLRVPAAEIYPAKEFLQICFDNRVPITLGSDAHKPEHVGHRFNEALALVRSAGYKQIVLFSHRNKNYYRI